MRSAVVTKVRVEEEKKNNLIVIVKKYLLKPLTGGIIGYLGFFSLLLISKYLGFLIGNRASFQIDLTDLLISLLGFVFIFIVKLKENSKESPL